MSYLFVLTDSLSEGKVIEPIEFKERINKSMLKKLLNTKKGKDDIIDFIDKSVQYEQYEAIQHFLECLYWLWIDPETRYYDVKEIIEWRKHIFEVLFSMEKIVLQWIEQDKILYCQLVMTHIDAIITAWKRELNKNLLTSTYMPEEEQSNLNQKIIKFRKEVWRYSTIDAMNENMVRFLNDEAREHGYVEELDSINCTIFHQLFDKINEDSDQIDQVVSMYRVLERLFGFEKVVSLCCKRDTNNQTAIEILLIKLQNIYKRSNSKYRERK